MIVRATNQYEKLNVTDKELKRVPKEGEQFEITKERYDVLTKTNEYKVKFVQEIDRVQEIETAKKKVITEKAIKTTTKKEK